MANILVVYYAHIPHRSTVRDHLYAFRKYLHKHNVVYLNLGIRTVPWHIKKMKIDLIIFHTIFVATHYDHEHFQRALSRADYFRQVNTLKIMLPQDEYVNSDGLCEFIHQFGITHVFTVSPESEWRKIYPSIDPIRVKFFGVLTGYLDENTSALIHERAKVITNRTIDISYRAGGHRPWLGRHGLLKAQLSDVFNEKAKNTSLRVDISTKHEDTIFGDKWYDFLLSSKYTIGVEGGASLLDKDISLREQTVQFMQEHPDSTMDEIEQNCFPGMDGALRYFAISPRHLEACVTKTCQILIEGHYNGVLQPGIHYIKLKNDFSNVDNIIEMVQKDDIRNTIVERAYRDVVLSGEYTYKAFVQFIFNKTIGDEKTYSRTLFAEINNSIILRISTLDDMVSNALISINEVVNTIFNISPPDSIFKKIKRIVRY